ncbi:hypothetical protein Ac2012v2_000976 [Leucoagaricus gongylophorus]
MGHMKTNRKCPRWAEFNSGTIPPSLTPSTSATSPPPPTAPGLANLGFNRGPPIGGSSLSFGFPAAVPSPLATSPPMQAMDDDNTVPLPGTPSSSAAAGPKIKLTLKRG